MALAIFDLDNTLIAGDSDYAWGEFLVEQNMVDSDAYQKANAKFYQQYKEGNLDIFEFLAFSLKPLSQYPTSVLMTLRQQFLQQKIEPMMLPAAHALIEMHRKQGDNLLIITATNSFVTAPIAQRLGIEHLIATDPELIDGHYTGKVAGTPSFKEGKVERLNAWLKDKHISLENSYFYSDSHNDLPLLNLVSHPIAVDPDAILQDYAKQHGWKILSLR